MSGHHRWPLPGDPTPAKQMIDDRAQREQAAADSIRDFYGGKPAPLPEGVAPYRPHGEQDDEAADEQVIPLDEKVWSTAELRSARSKAQGRAKTQLAHEFRMRYRALYQQELEREGLTVTRHRRLGYPASKTIAREAENPEIPINGPYYYPSEEQDED